MAMPSSSTVSELIEAYRDVCTLVTNIGEFLQNIEIADEALICALRDHQDDIEQTMTESKLLLEKLELENGTH